VTLCESDISDDISCADTRIAVRFDLLREKAGGRRATAGLPGSLRWLPEMWVTVLFYLDLVRERPRIHARRAAPDGQAPAPGVAKLDTAVRCLSAPYGAVSEGNLHRLPSRYHPADRRSARRQQGRSERRERSGGFAGRFEGVETLARHSLSQAVVS
jgi:hypothetical protein